MQNLVSSLSSARQQHIDGINSFDLKSLREQTRRSYVPRLRGKDELLLDIKMKKSWKGSGSENGYFMQPAIMKPKMLDPWTAGRVQQPVRAYEKYFFLDKAPFQYTASHGRECGVPPKAGLPDGYKEYLKKREKEFIEWTECPSKHEKDKDEPHVQDKINSAKFFRAGLTEGEFKDGKHVPWEAFQKTMKTRNYEAAITGTMYPKRTDHKNDQMWTQVAMRATSKALGRSRTLERFKTTACGI